jgi:ferredoxin
VTYTIIDTCTACGLCLTECPIDSIEIGDPIYVINDTCCDFEDCLAVCPVDAIVRVEEALARAAHPERNVVQSKDALSA